MDYAVPRAEHFPIFELHRTETPSPLNPLGAKGIGEAATIGSTPAVVNAVMDALEPFGITHLDMPLRPEKIWAALNGVYWSITPASRSPATTGERASIDPYPRRLPRTSRIRFPGSSDRAVEHSIHGCDVLWQRLEADQVASQRSGTGTSHTDHARTAPSNAPSTQSCRIEAFSQASSH